MWFGQLMGDEVVGKGSWPHQISHSEICKSDLKQNQDNVAFIIIIIANKNTRNKFKRIIYVGCTGPDEGSKRSQNF